MRREACARYHGSRSRWGRALVAEPWRVLCWGPGAVQLRSRGYTPAAPCEDEAPAGVLCQGEVSILVSPTVGTVRTTAYPNRPFPPERASLPQAPGQDEVSVRV